MRCPFAIAMLSLTACTGRADTLMPGQWEVTTRIDTLIGANSTSAGAMKPPKALVTRHCLTRPEAAKPSAGFLTGNGARANCAYNGFLMADGRITAVVSSGSGR